ncbi:hypothetical protein glysoja_008982, partial [Glycine soja]
PNWLIQGFKEVVSDCNLHDDPMEGYKYTWTRRKGKPNGVEETIDSAPTNIEWFDKFPNFCLV